MAIGGASKAWSSAVWLVLAVGLAAVVPSSEVYVFYAGGRDGWVVNPAESYNHWAERNRFHVGDTIVFTHKEAAGSVLLVTEKDFDACDTRSPVRQLDAAGGRSVFRFDRSGPFFFISGDEDRCQKGQKLYVVVMAVRQTTQTTAFPPAGSTAAPPFWASVPEYAQAPGISALGDSGDKETSRSSLGAPPPMSGAALLDEVAVGTVLGVLGAFLVL